MARRLQAIFASLAKQRECQNSQLSYNSQQFTIYGSGHS